MTMTKKVRVSGTNLQEQGYWHRLKRDLVKNKMLYLLVLPVIAFYLIFNYVQSTA